MDSNKQTEFTERRRKKDWIVRAVSVTGVIGWISAAAAVLLLDAARPAQETVVTRFFGTRVVSYWNPLFLRLSYIAGVEVFLLCLLGFMFNLMRRRRKTDRLNNSIIILWVISVTFLIIMTIRFGYLIF
ncbi:MAG: hypothetical protein FWH16_01950 [Oscillospiraceae bacterium]|nr:hypothetical protein [Oscillospiraceae bacterium]